ncbi:hypothetical protein N219_12360 [Limosilactobacillus fermentum MTCC 8711]|nr:hypothetical protein N219_12360 [Limosilactobacillus fermentum MTCC 8711]
MINLYIKSQSVNFVDTAYFLDFLTCKKANKALMNIVNETIHINQPKEPKEAPKGFWRRLFGQ